mmetsp:Transcript_21790/g.49289  ORF Transcript_21790/g.49289 Transcript_21790/m.49289 type:complete len:545 (-) Transcript_21790:267-1901(-)|eukprot:CAMPEP_0172585982 /NCGR_PEP_ID=MMETSP1068-20121228/5377_1 /TAXON_ID=35684 /ORGANISM="Pseudopedinella elastica, Strain CCMP716" /LENGTH=544 /DNA_ID=CAMNT_0013380641 /DNA_START=167 /DNA_END=1801 /DNA_ORIENTATION=-
MTDSAEEYQATQAESYPETQIEEDWTSHETVSDVDDTVLWGTLKNQGGLAHIELRTKPESVVQGKDELHEHVIGRNPALCDHVVDFDQRISGRHCRVFCTRDGNFHIQNLSGNFTFVRTVANPGMSVVLNKTTEASRKLNSGDMVTLLCPNKVSRDVLDKATFTFLREGNSVVGVSAGISSASTGPQVHATHAHQADSQEAALEYSFTTALQANRSVEAFYDLQRSSELGRGQFGVVYRGVNRQTGEEWAVKEQDTRRALFGHQSGGDTLEQLVNECRVLKGLRHPYLCVPEDVFLDQTRLYIIQPLCDGGDLFDRIVTKYPRGYPEASARELLSRLVQAVEFLHANNVVHRDLKPENILLQSRNSDVEIKIVDFGLAKRDAKCTTFCGTPQYFAPEVLQRGAMGGVDRPEAGEYGKEADMWSVGVIAYVVLSGSPAFVGNLEQKIPAGEYAPMTGKRWQDKSDGAKGFVRSLILVDHAKRLTAAQARKHALVAPPPATASSRELPPPRPVGQGEGSRKRPVPVSSPRDSAASQSEAKASRARS